MKRILPILASLSLAAGVFAADKNASPSTVTNLPPKILSFCADKEQQVKRLAAKLKVEVLPTALDYFEAVKKGDWEQASDLYREVKEFLGASSKSEDQATLDATTSAAALEVQLAMEQFVEGEPKYALAFGREIVRSIPPGSIYFGGTDPGRGLVTALSASHEKADPFFTLTQNALAGDLYLTYLRTMYGGKIYTPTKQDSQAAFKGYLDDAGARLQHDEQFPTEPKQLKPGENVTRRDNRLSVGGQVAVMAINGLLAKRVFDQNPDRECFVEESMPIDWMYPHLTPHGLILKLNRKAPESIPPEAVAKDRKFWLEQQRGMIGGWLKLETSLKDVCAFAEKVFVKRDLSGFDGDPKFVQSSHATRMYSKLRSAIGGVYAWRAANTKDKVERERMEKEAVFAFRQAFAMCPSSPEVVFRYVNLLLISGRADDAKLLVDAASEADPGNGQFDSLAKEVGSIQKRVPSTTK